MPGPSACFPAFEKSPVNLFSEDLKYLHEGKYGEKAQD